MTEDAETAGQEPDPAGVRLAQEIRRRRKAADHSHAQLAQAIGYTRQYLSLAERPGKGLPSAELVRAIDGALDAGGALLALRDEAVAERQALRENMGGTHAPSVEDVEPDSPVDLVDVDGVETPKRRELITVAAAVAFGAALNRPATRIIAEADVALVPATVRPGDVRELQQTVEVLEAWDHQAGGTAVRHHILGALRWGTGLLDSSCTPAVRGTLAATVAQLADLAAWATFDTGLHRHARELFLLGLQAAHESGDLGMRAHVATGLARQEIATGRPDVALELVQLAHTAADALTPNAVSMLHAVKALAYARKSDTTGCHRFVHAATDCYRPDLIGNDPAWIRFFSPAKLDGDTANALFDLLVVTAPHLGRAEATKGAARTGLVDRLSRVVARYPDSRARSKAIAAARLATLLYLEGEPGRANIAARTAIDVADGVRSARLGSDLRVLARATGAAPKDTTALALRAEAHDLALTMT